MYCSNCGTKLKDNAIFCEKCGTKVIRVIESSGNNAGKALLKNTDTSKNKSKFLTPKALIPSIVILFVVIFVISSVVNVSVQLVEESKIKSTLLDFAGALETYDYNAMRECYYNGTMYSTKIPFSDAIAKAAQSVTSFFGINCEVRMMKCTIKFTGKNTADAYVEFQCKVSGFTYTETDKVSMIKEEEKWFITRMESYNG